MKILILRFSSIGDIVLTTPVVRCLKTQLPDAEIHFVTKKAYRTLIENNPYIDRYFLLENELNTLVTQLLSERYDYIIDLHNNLRTLVIKARLSLKSGVKCYSFDKLNIEKWLLVNLKINRLPDVHIVDRYMKTVESLGVVNDDKGLDYFIPKQDEVTLESLPKTHQNGYIAFAIGGQHSTKKLPIERMVELCRRINQPIILLGGKEDVETGEKLIQLLPTSLAPSIEDGEYHSSPIVHHSSLAIYNACGKYNLNQSASLVKQADVIYTHDTGLMHVASAFKKKIVSIWGSTVPAFGMYPYQTNFVTWQVNDLPCRPCSKIGYDQCPKGHFKCMNEIVFEEK